MTKHIFLMVLHQNFLMQSSFLFFYHLTEKMIIMIIFVTTYTFFSGNGLKLHEHKTARSY